MRRPTGTTVVVGAALVLAGAATPAVAATPGTAAAVARPASPIQWQPCEGHPALDCATVPMPIDWSAPAGPATPIAIIRGKAAKPEQRKGVLLVDPGGPGGSGVDFATDIVEDHALSPSLTDAFDVIGFDPRGVSRSAALTCDDVVLNDWVDFYPETGPVYRGLIDHNDRLGRSCRQYSGPLADHADTTSVVRDVDALRQALGEDKISYYGRSYGTQIGEQYAELFGSHLRALALDSVMDHSVDTMGFLAPQNLAFEDSFTDFTAWCGRTAACSLHDRDGLALWDGLYAKAAAGKLNYPGSSYPISVSQLRDTVLFYLYDPARWAVMADWLKSIADGNPGTTLARSTEPGTRSELPIWCGDWKWDEVDSLAALTSYRELSETVAPHTRLSPLYTQLTECLGWGGRVSNPQHRLHVTQAPPILMTNSVHDVATPYQWARSVAAQLPTSTLLTYDGTGHGDYRLSSCARAAIDTYLITLRTPAPGTHCPAEWPTTGSAGTPRATAQPGSPPARRG
ncbi:alpha/beta hydrolase [Amycolatopsis sp. PS_44_ISF1]|uniref:alpha/beta hydrolase n=1 Tax=Amycolatopsis sp. PS_44_ISF1 TaxID=2974917 RepID=UPI0028DDAB1C|nr:alpha/beta hydrolase [Amycolatopsis sp. PS_44_ISF1]MDT8914107.1 alpha/beta hydrolase [Amycolatopsis sp. PS_44_ISF1]